MNPDIYPSVFAGRIFYDYTYVFSTYADTFYT
jgi:hypothetical protein